MTRPTLSAIPLRARKRAQTRIDLVEALVERLGERTSEDIGVSELAEAAGVSEATFFNYFPSKSHLLTHFIQQWSLKVSALARRISEESDGPLAAIEEIFVSTAEQTAENPKVLLEIIAHQARMPPDLKIEPIELSERLLLLPDESEIESLPDRGLGDILPRLLAEAVARGELPRNTDVKALARAVASVFFGVPLTLAASRPEAVAAVYREQLAFLWAGARSTESEGS